MNKDQIEEMKDTILIEGFVREIKGIFREIRDTANIASKESIEWDKKYSTIKDDIGILESLMDELTMILDGKEFKDIKTKDEFEIPEKLKKFLKEHDAYEKYVANVKNDEEYNINFKECTSDNYIWGAFNWSKTEGDSYWGPLNRKWCILRG